MTRIVELRATVAGGQRLTKDPSATMRTPGPLALVSANHALPPATACQEG